MCVVFKMSRRKFKPCPSCQALNQVSLKTCSSCFAAITQKKKVAAKKVTLDRKWGERVLKNRNAGRVVDSAHIAVKKLSALGYVPILFFAKKDKASGKWVADVVTHLTPTEDNLKIVATMRKAYNFLLIKEGNSTTTLPEPQHQTQPKPQHQAQPEPQHQAQPKHQHQAQPKPQHQAQPKPQHQVQPKPQHQVQPKHQHQAQPKPQHQVQPEPQHQAQPEPQPQFLALAESQSQAQENETFYLLDLYPVSPPPPTKKRKCCRKCSRQKVFKYDSITGRRINEGQAEVRVKWLPCSAWYVLLYIGLYCLHTYPFCFHF
uniref:Uncharacterized protein n=1 Tax=Cyprinus carpio carpio TaxID=630221 RepID=A0A9J8CBW0_CYPCA